MLTNARAWLKPSSATVSGRAADADRAVQRIVCTAPCPNNAACDRASPAVHVHLRRSGRAHVLRVDTNPIWRRAASYVAKIFRGALPADLPVERVTNFEMAVNFNTMKMPRKKVNKTLKNYHKVSQVCTIEP